MSSWDTELAYSSLDALVGVSPLILLGEITENVSHLSKSGEYITTDYKLYVRETLKGDVTPSSQVVFQVMGGKVYFEDGSSAQMETRGFVRPNMGARVVIFAQRARPEHIADSVREYSGDAPVLNLVGLSRGVLELPDNDDEMVKVKAKSAKDKLANDTRKTSAKKFLVDLEKAVARDRRIKARQAAAR